MFCTPHSFKDAYESKLAEGQEHGNEMLKQLGRHAKTSGLRESWNPRFFGCGCEVRDMVDMNDHIPTRGEVQRGKLDVFAEEDGDEVVPPCYSGDSELGKAARRGKVTELERLLTNGVDPNVRDYWGQTALFQAASAGHVQAVASLMLARADPTRTSQAGQCALDVANDTHTHALMAALAPMASKLAPDCVDLDQALATLPTGQRMRFEEEALECNRRNFAI